MGLCLFARDPYEEVATRVTGSLAERDCWNASWPVPTASAISQARKRLGRDIIKALFYRTAEPVAECGTHAFVDAEVGAIDVGEKTLAGPCSTGSRTGCSRPTAGSTASTPRARPGAAPL
jgi:hypothetical protein